MCLKTDNLNFLDITNYLAPGFNYEQFLKAYEVDETKGFLPYEWITDLEKLDHQELPEHTAFFSTLKNTNITAEEYEYCQGVWRENNMVTFRDFLVWYNNLDVKPFITAVEKMMVFWKERGIDMFKDGVSVPGLTMKFLFKSLDEKTYFSIFNEKNKDLDSLFRANNTGGPSIIFNRQHEAGTTYIRDVEMREKGLQPKQCQKLVGYDANALYLWAIMQDMPCGSYTRRRAENNFKRENSRRMADEWIAWEQHQRDISIRHQLNNTEKRIGARRLPVDGFHADSQTVFQFHGKFT